VFLKLMALLYVWRIIVSAPRIKNIVKMTVLAVLKFAMRTSADPPTSCALYVVLTLLLKRRIYTP